MDLHLLRGHRAILARIRLALVKKIVRGPVAKPVENEAIR